MAQAAVYNQTGEKITDLDLNPKVFGLEKIDAHLVHVAVRTQRNNARRSIGHTKNRGEVAGSGRKPWKQKGTGRARVGSVRSPIWRHGGVTFGPTNARNWSLSMNKPAFRKALFTVLTDKVNDHKLVIIDNFDTTAKSKELFTKLNVLAAKAGLGHKYVLVLPGVNQEMERAGRNLVNVKILSANQLNVLDLLKFDTMIMKDALPVIEKTYLKDN
jgi:large subunit ribosomal protein L4